MQQNELNFGSGVLQTGWASFPFLSSDFTKLKFHCQAIFWIMKFFRKEGSAFDAGGTRSQSEAQEARKRKAKAEEAYRQTVKDSWPNCILQSAAKLVKF